MTDGKILTAALAGTGPAIFGAACPKFTPASFDELRPALGGHAIDMPMIFMDMDDQAMGQWWTRSSLAADIGADAYYVTWSTSQSPLSVVLDGSRDEYLRKAGAEIARHGKPVLFRLEHEMNGGSWNNYGHGQETPEEFIAGWRYVHAKLTAAGATNLRWFWCPNFWQGAGNANTADPRPFYPGDDYVDTIGLDAYTTRGNGLKAPRAAILANYQSLTALTDKPFILGEFGVESGSVADEPAWHAALWALIREDMPRLVGAAVWDRAPYRVGASSRAAFAAGVTAPPFTPTPQEQPVAIGTGYLTHLDGASIYKGTVPAGPVTLVLTGAEGPGSDVSVTRGSDVLGSSADGTVPCDFTGVPLGGATLYVRYAVAGQRYDSKPKVTTIVAYVAPPAPEPPVTTPPPAPAAGDGLPALTHRTLSVGDHRAAVGAEDAAPYLQRLVDQGAADRLPVVIPPGRYPLSRTVRYKAAQPMLSGSGIATDLRPAPGVSALIVEQPSLDIRSGGHVRDLSITGPTRAPTDKSVGLTISKCVQLITERVNINNVDIGLAWVNNCFGSVARDLSIGFGGKVNVGIDLREGWQSGSDLSIYDPWVHGRIAGIHVSGGGGGYHVYGGQVTGGQSTTAPNPNGGAVVIGRDYLTGRTGETSIDFTGTSFEGTNYVSLVRIHDQARVNLDGVNFAPQERSQPAIHALHLSNFKNGAVRIRGHNIGGAFSAAQLVRVDPDKYGGATIIEEIGYSSAHAVSIAGADPKYTTSLLEQSRPVGVQWKVIKP